MLVRLQNGVKFIYELLFPPFCLNCGAEGDYICHDCSLFLVEAEPACPCCGYPSEGGKKHNGCQGILEGQLVVWEEKGLTGEIIKTVHSRRATHLLEDFVLKSLKVVLANSSFECFWSVWFDRSTAVVSCPSPEEEKGQNYSDLAAEELVKLTERDQKMISGSSRERAVIVSLFFHQEIVSRAESLKANGFQEVWSLVLIAKSC